MGDRRLCADAGRDAADGRRAVFAAGLLRFTLLSAACGAASSGLALDLARGAQGVGAAAMFAASLALLAHEFQGPERGLALGIWGSHHRRRARGRARCRSLFAAAVLLGAFVAIERRSTSPMLSLSLFRIPAFTGTAHVAFAQSVALYPLFLFLALYFQELLELSPTETGVRLLPIIRTADSRAVGLVAGLNAIFLVAAVVVVVTAVIAWPLLGRLRSST